MRRFIPNNVATEERGDHPDKGPVTGGSNRFVTEPQEGDNKGKPEGEGEAEGSVATEHQLLSLEEEAIIVSEATDEAQTAQQEIAQAERIIEVSDALEDLAIVADEIETATPRELDLIASAGQMAVAGTDVEPEDVVPALESYLGKKVAVENFREKAAQIWEKTMAFLKQIWERIVRAFGVHVRLPRLATTIASIEGVAKSAGKLKEGAQGEFEYSASASFYFAGSAVTNAGDLRKALTNVEEAVKFVFDEYPKDLAKRGAELGKLIGEFTPETSGKVVADVRAFLLKESHKVPGGGSGRKQGDFLISEGAPLLGGDKLVSKEATSDESDSILGSLDRLRTSGIFLQNEGARSAGMSKFKVMSPAEVEAVAKTAHDIIKLLSDFDAHGLKELKKGADDIAAGAKKANENLNKAKAENADAGAGQVVAEFRAALNFGVAYARWSQNPSLPLFNRAITAVSAALSLCSKSLAHYDTAAE